MAKDAKGHGSEKRGESSGDPNGRHNPLFDPVKAAMASARGTMRGYTDASPLNMLSDKGAAATLANDHPKSDAVPVHSGAAGRNDEGGAGGYRHDLDQTGKVGPFHDSKGRPLYKKGSVL